jgi:hypothetical protein
MTNIKKDKQYNDQHKEGQAIQLLIVLLYIGHCIACPSLYWSLYCLTFFILVIVLIVLLYIEYNDQYKEGQSIQ